MKILAPARNGDALAALFDAGADSCYIGLNRHNARTQNNLEGLNVTVDELAAVAAACRARGKELFIALNGFPTDSGLDAFSSELADATRLPISGLIVANLGMLDLVRTLSADVPIKLSIQNGACNADEILVIDRLFTLSGVTLPRFLRLEEVAEMRRLLPARIEIEVLGHGLICPNVEGQCFLGSFLLNSSANQGGVGGPESLAGDRATLSVIFDLLLDNPPEVLEQGIVNLHPCQGVFCGTDRSGERRRIRLHEHLKVASLDLVHQLMAAGVGRLKIEGRQHPVPRVVSMVEVYRHAIDQAVAFGMAYRPDAADRHGLAKFELYRDNLTDNHFYHNPLACRALPEAEPATGNGEAGD